MKEPDTLQIVTWPLADTRTLRVPTVAFEYSTPMACPMPLSALKVVVLPEPDCKAMLTEGKSVLVSVRSEHEFAVVQVQGELETTAP